MYLGATSSLFKDKLATIVNRIPSTEVIRVKGTGIDTMLPGANLLPASVGAKLTVKNALIGAGVAVAAYLGYTFLVKPPAKKPSTAAKPSTASTGTVAGLFGLGRRRRRRR